MGNALALFGLLAGLVTLGAWPIVRAYDKGRTDVVEARERGYVDAAALELRGALREITGDLQVTGNLPAMRRYLDHPEREPPTAIGDAFCTIMDAYGRYDEIRMVDARGRELVRALYENGRARAVPDAELRAAADDPGLAATAALGRGEIEVTPFVHAAADRATGSPARLRLRVSAPVFDGGGNRLGALVMSVNGADMLQRFRDLTAAEPQHDALLLDAQARVLTRTGGPATRPGRTDAPFAAAFPAEWATIRTNDRGAIRSERGLFVYATVLLPASAAGTGPAASIATPAAPEITGSRALGHWKVVLRMSREMLLQRSLLRLPVGWLLFATIYLLLLLLSMLAAYTAQHFERTRRAERVAAEEIRDLYERAPCGYHSLDRNGVIVRMNQTELDWLGYRREEVIGRMKMTDLMTEAGRETFAHHFPRVLQSEQVGDIEFDLIRKDGSVLPVLVNATAARDEDGNFLMSRSTVFDATEHRKLEQELMRQARTDVLTGASNRRHFFELAPRELARSARLGSPLSLLVLDIDEFKQINDAHGHDAGDVVLKVLAAACEAALRETDLFSRVGGEEFAALLPDADADLALTVAERLRAQVANLSLVLPDGAPLRLTVSIGVAVLAPGDISIDRLMKRADMALYQAKAAGRNRVCMSGCAAVSA